MTVFLLPDEPLFPPVDEAEPDGLVAIGGDLSPGRILEAYSHGIFPWFREEDDIFWYSPDPRMVMLPEKFTVPRSLDRIIRSNRFVTRFDSAFDQVIRQCAASPRPDQEGTWISGDFIEAYNNMYNLGFAHSAEVYHGNDLVGGLYGISIGAAFFGESMFYRMSNASKVALYALVERCRQYGFRFIDCQVETPHLLRLGARLIARKEYIELLTEALKDKTMKGPWIS